MLETERIITAISIVWAVIILIAQWALARGTGRRDHSVKAGSTVRGVIYNFTWALMPQHKETIRNHPLKFTIGVLMHIGVFIAIAKVLILLVFPRMNPFSPVILGVMLIISSLCGLYLFLRRVFSIELRSMSSPEDYFSILITIAFILVASAHEFGLMSAGIFLLHAAVVFFYLPVGKLKHALFFFIARTDYGIRLGYRGTYPAKSGVNE